ncbi:OmpA family protein [Nonlabens sp. SY33080]|uniref:OmpA family protein n=1 Tax=Nonlabens sp. SY33080 TaxID=2719911 RepID=UPI001428ACF0|nr:OmpA family protein [Nonlabens sp. SY33080]
MKLKYISTLLLVTFILNFSYAQKKSDLEKANKKYDQLAFFEAQKLYKKLFEDGYESPEILSKLADAYYFNDELEKSNKYYTLLFEKYKESVKPEYYFRHAQTLKATGQYQKADELMATFNSFKGFDSRAKKYSDEPNYLQIIDFQSGRFIIKNAEDVNSYTSDFGTAYYYAKDKVVFATSRDTSSLINRRHTWSGQAFLELYEADETNAGELRNAKEFKGVLNTRFHESTPTFTKDGNTVYFTRNNYSEGVARQDIDGVNRLKIYKSVKKGKRWSQPVELPFNSDEYSTAHPALSPDETKLYFSSDMPGSVGYDMREKFGKSDLWVVDILEDGNYSEPRNLENVNTEGRESFPFVSSNNTLYFASTGHQGLGGLDVFASSIKPDGSVSNVVNIGSPINTQYDDFSFIINDGSKRGYFSSNRPGGIGDDDIYSFIQTEEMRKECEHLLSGTVTDKNTGAPIDGALVTVVDANNNIVGEVITKANGKFVFKLECDKQYFLRGEKREYGTDEDLFTTPSQTDYSDIPLELSKNKQALADCDDIAPLLNIKQIYFDFDKSNIRPDAAAELTKIKAFMELYPQIAVEIRSHTDSRAPDDYNDALSDRRARSTRQWLIDNGIDASRLTAKGYGERQLLNKCSNGVECTPEEHQLNRRSEFIISGLGKISNCN